VKSKLAIGTAQFGLNYGITNQNGQVELAEVKNILKYAKKNQIITIDTAIAYGTSELSIGNSNINGLKIFTKLPNILKSSDDIDFSINRLVDQSMTNLKVSQLEGIFFHNPLQLLSKEGKQIWDSVRKIKKEGKIKKIGISVYNPGEIERLWNIFSFDAIQAPFNILDRRIKTSGWLKKMNESDVEVHVRSVFLQGLLLMNPIERNILFSKWKSTWIFMDSWLNKNNLSPIEAALGFVLSEKLINYIVIGVESKDQLKQIVEIAKRKFNQDDFPESLSIEDLDLIEPVNWRQK
jgi:aryl-alcohol dehydrogenase-like predicted oxidoreductase